jgi:hypothetical protein
MTVIFSRRWLARLSSCRRSLMLACMIIIKRTSSDSQRGPPRRRQGEQLGHRARHDPLRRHLGEGGDLSVQLVGQHGVYVFFSSHTLCDFIKLKLHFYQDQDGRDHIVVCLCLQGAYFSKTGRRPQF